MTEQTFPSGGTAVAEPPMPALPMDGGDAVDDGNRRKLLLAGAALAVLVLGIAAFFLLKGGGSSTPAASSSPTTSTPVTTPKVTHHKAAAKKPLTLPKRYHGHVGRDPFTPLYSEPAAAAAPTTTTDGSTSTTTDGSTGSTTDGSTTTTGSTGGTTTHKAVYRPIWLQLHRLSGNKVVFDVGYSNRSNLRVLRFTVTAPKGDVPTVFAKNFSLLHVSGSDVTVRYGDGTTFILTPAQNMMIVN